MDDEEKAYDEGWRSSYLGYGLRENPYKRHSEMWDSWRDGWLDNRKSDPYWSDVKKYQRNARRKLKKQ